MPAHEEAALCKAQANLPLVNQAALGVRTAAVHWDQQKAFLKYLPQSLSPEKRKVASAVLYMLSGRKV